MSSSTARQGCTACRRDSAWPAPAAGGRLPPGHGGAAGAAAAGCIRTWAGSTWPGVAAVAVLLVYEHSLVRPDDLTRVNRGVLPGQRRGEHRPVRRLAAWTCCLSHAVILRCLDHCKVVACNFGAGHSASSGTNTRSDYHCNDPATHLPLRSDSRQGRSRRAAVVRRRPVSLSARRAAARVGELANLVRERKNGNRAYYNINTHLNPTNVCVYRCVFCAFRSDLRSPKGYLMSDEQILARGQEAVECGCTEMHIVGGLHHQMKYDWYLNLIRIAARGLSAAAPEGLDGGRDRLVHAADRQEVDPRGARRDDRRRPGQPARRRGRRSSIPKSATRSASTRPTPAAGSTSIARPTSSGLRTNATMLYGHIENAYHRVDHLVRLRELQDETGGFQTFIPLAFHPDNTGLEPHQEAVGPCRPAHRWP